MPFVDDEKSSIYLKRTDQSPQARFPGALILLDFRSLLNDRKTDPPEIQTVGSSESRLGADSLSPNL
jgi:hypothetical protein